MAWTDALRFRLTALFQSGRIEAEMESEMRAHFEQLVEDFQAEGHSLVQATRLARREFGSMDRAKEDCRQSWGLQLLFDFGRDLRFAARQLGKSKGFAAIYAGAIAVAIAACSVVFSILDGILFRPLPFPQADQLVTIWEVADFGRNSVSGGAFQDWRSRSAILDAVMVVAPITANLRDDEGATQLTGREVSASFLEVLSIPPLRGRGFLPSEEQVNGPAVIMLTEACWRSRFAADPAIVGAQVTLDGEPRTVVGILPALAWLEPWIDYFAPAVLDPSQAFRSGRSNHWAYVWGRLKSGTSPEQLETELKAIKSSLEAEYPSYKKDWSVAVAPLRQSLAESARPALALLSAAVGLVLLIACANAANLQLARATRRRGELAMRRALGASRSRLLRQSLTESLLLASAGGIAGTLIALIAMRLARTAAAEALPAAMIPELDARALLACLSITIVAAFLAGILPAWSAGRTEIAATLSRGGKSATTRGRARSQSFLVIGEVALTVALLSAAGLLLQSLANKVSQDPGYEPSHTITFDLTLPGTIYDSPDKRIAYTGAILNALRGLPGIDSAASLSASPLRDGTFGQYVSREDQPSTRLDRLATLIYAGDGFFETLQARLIRGRGFAASDNRPDAAPVTVIDRTLADKLYPESEAIGQFINLNAQAWEIVGIVENMLLDPNPRPAGYAYLPHAYFPFAVSIVARIQRPSTEMLPEIEAAVASVDSGIAMAHTRTLQEALASTREPDRLVLALIAVFAAIALLLASAGLYGVASYTTAARRREFCIRRALGATPTAVLRLALADGARLIALGLSAGLALALAASRLIESELYGVSPYNPTVAAATIALLGAIGLAACMAPAIQAARADLNRGIRND